MRCFYLPFLACLSLLPFAATAVAAGNVTVTTLNWPPYTSNELPKSGATTEVVRQAFAAAGLETEVVFLPWKRAIAVARNSPDAVAYFPGYHCRHVEGFVASEPIGSGPLGLAEHVDNPVTWQTIDDLGEQKLKIGTVLGYANTDEFDEKAGTGWVTAIPANDDLTNLKKLLRQRIDAAVIDKLVLAFLLATEPELKDEAASIRFNDHPLEEKTLRLCFVDDENGNRLRETFNTGLAQIDVEAIVDQYFATEF